MFIIHCVCGKREPLRALMEVLRTSWVGRRMSRGNNLHSPFSGSTTGEVGWKLSRSLCWRWEGVEGGGAAKRAFFFFFSKILILFLILEIEF